TGVTLWHDAVGDRAEAGRAAGDGEDPHPHGARAPPGSLQGGRRVSPEMSRDELQELAAGYALGSLDAEDRGRFEALLRGGDEAARRALREYEETLVRVAAERPESPPPDVKAALLARIPATPRAGNGARVMPLTPRPRRSVWTVVLAGAMAAG